MHRRLLAIYSEIPEYLDGRNSPLWAVFIVTLFKSGGKIFAKAEQHAHTSAEQS